ncbi:MAG: bifunctional 5,10-methylenetetrahydrofolate dehydrogenase/5,10-methenyltetrahydrofolate cyclohydrolase [Patescibacteria group bacterium]
MLAQLLDGKQLATKIRSKVKAMIATLPSRPGMVAILVGNDPASHLYVSLKEKACEEVSIRFEKFLYPSSISTDDLVAKINELNHRAEIHGILVQFPLPSQDEDRVVQAIDPLKDIDGFHPENIRRLGAGEPGLVPPVALGIMKLIDATGVDVRNKTAQLICSEFFARPLMVLLKERGIKSVNYPVTQLLNYSNADILIVALGKPHSIKANQVKPGAIVIDVGTTKTPEGLLGDVDPSVAKIAGFLTPVPGGVGPMTVALLTLNVVKAMRLQLAGQDSTQ